jgi:hypothetical protein
MKQQAYATMLTGIAMLVFGAAGATAQSDKKHDADKHGAKAAQHDMSKMDMAHMMNQPHAALAMSYRQNIVTFGKTLNNQAKGNGPLDVSLARTAVAEIRRGFDQMEAHHGEHARTMSADMRTRMAAMMRDMDTHRSMLRDAVVALETDVRAAQPDARQVAMDSANLLKHLDAMSKMHEAKKGKETK